MLAYYATFSIAPILVMAIAVAGFASGAEAARGDMVTHISGVTGTSGTEAMHDLLAAACQSDSGFRASVISGFASLLVAIRVFAKVKDSLDVI